jgi:hypothetical protein
MAEYLVEKRYRDCAAGDRELEREGQLTEDDRPT